jgi:hypothetical protein
MLWGTLQGQRVMEEFLGHEFSGHAKLALILHEHLINFSTPLSKFEEFAKKMEEKLEQVRRTANSAQAAANARKGGKAGPAENQP